MRKLDKGKEDFALFVVEKSDESEVEITHPMMIVGVGFHPLKIRAQREVKGQAQSIRSNPTGPMSRAQQ